MAKLNRVNFKSLIIILACVAGVFFYLTYVNKSKEGFEDSTSMGQDIENEIMKQYMDENLNDLSDEELKSKVAGLRARLAKFGLYPNASSPDMSKYMLKSEQKPGDGQCNVATANDRDKYILKSAIPEQKCPGVDMTKYVLKSAVQPEKICPPPKEIDYSRYVLKSTLPPAQKCPPCVCPKVKVSAGLCKACPPPPKAKCPEVKPCPVSKCPEPKPCPAQPEPTKCHEVKYIKQPVVLKQTVKVNERGEIIEESEPKPTNNNANNNLNNHANNNGVNNNSPVAANITQDEIDNLKKNSSSVNTRTLNQYYRNQVAQKSPLTTDRHNNNSELLNDQRFAYGKSSNLDAYNPTTTPLSDTISSNLADQNNASPNENSNNATSLNELAKQEMTNNGQLFNANTRPIKQVAQPHFTSTMEKQVQGTKTNNMLTNQPEGQGAKCGPIKFNNVFRRYGVYGSQ